ncbi:hypothetical protein WAI453_008919 [Rhynchosporium graminicola]|uniref:Protein kinase domain-containing protein n=1 Tax=Rhynchosporium graminicola TaxID=2792576 RepID=A0A1E1LRL2_9HELO|nr:uncharacterized protein RCO7_07687 [Rhynchosporium commune]
MQTFHLENFIYYAGDDFEKDKNIRIFLRCFGACFEIQYLSDNLSTSPSLLRQYEKSLHIVRASWDSTQTADKAIEEIKLLKTPFEALMTELAPVSYPSVFTLWDFLYVPPLILEARADPEDTVIRPRLKGILPRQALVPPGEALYGGDWPQSIKSFTSRQISLVPTSTDSKYHPYLRGPAKVLVSDGTICHFKADSFKPGLVRRVIRGEGKPWIYQQIDTAIKAKLLCPDIRICRLVGVVIDKGCDVLSHYVRVSKEEIMKWYEKIDPEWVESEEIPDSERIVGILLTYIDNKGTLYQLAPSSNYSNEQRNRWAAELEDLVKELHAAGLVWGDAKPDNVLVDRMDRLWLIDFEGSYTEGWVDKDNMETQHGDLQAVKRTQGWLLKWSEKTPGRVVRQVMAPT